MASAQSRTTSNPSADGQHFIALLADATQPLMSSTGVLAQIQPQVTDHLAAARETVHRPRRQHESQRRDLTHSFLIHQSDRVRAPLGLGFYRRVTTSLAVV